MKKSVNIKQLSHLDERQQPCMVDVSAKPLSCRVAVAAGWITLQPATVRRIRASKIAKGNVLVTAELAGINAAKQTANLIPLCHIVPLTKVAVKATLRRNGVAVESEVKCTDRTGVEMEALTAVSVALLTVYDMCKAVDKTMVMGDVRLVSKTKQQVMAGGGA